MFCQKCGTQIAEGADFCLKCGAKVVYENTGKQPENAPQMIVGKNSDSVILDDGGDLKKFVDDHIRATTKFQSAEEMLKRSNPQLFVWICFIVPAIIGLIAGGPVGALLFAIVFGHTARWIAGGIIRMRCTAKTSGKFGGNIDTEQLCRFLNAHLNSLYPCFHQWNCQEGRMFRGEETWAEFKLSASFGEKERCTVTLYIRPEDPKPDAIKKYVTGVVDNGTTLSKIVGMTIFSLLQISDPRTACLLKTAPILQAAMMYYLEYDKERRN